MLNVDGNKDELVTLTAGGNDDDGSALGNHDDAVPAIHSMPSHVVMMHIYWDGGDCPKQNDWNCDQIRWITRGSHKITKSNPKLCKMYFTAQVSGSSKGSIEFVKYA